MKQPMRTHPQKTTRAMSAVGLFAGDQSEMGAMALRASRSSNFAADKGSSQKRSEGGSNEGEHKDCEEKGDKRGQKARQLDENPVR